MALFRRRRMREMEEHQMIRQRMPDWLQVDILIIVVGIAIIGAGILIAP